MRNRLREALEKEPLPEGLRERVAARIHKVNERHSRVSPMIVWVLALAATLVMCVGGVGLYRLWESRYNLTALTEAVLNVGVAAHVHCVIDSRIVSFAFTREQMALSMGKEYIGLVSLLERTLGRDFLVPVAHRCSTGGREYFHFVVKRQNQIASLIISLKKGEEFPPRASHNGAEVLGIPLYQAQLRGLDVVGFETDEHLVFVVSKQGGIDALQIAEQITVPISDFLSKLEIRSGLVPERY